MQVPESFQEVFTHFYVAENHTQHTVTKSFLPTFQTLLVFSFGAPVILVPDDKTSIEVEKCLIIGPVKKAFDYSLPPGSSLFVINFKDDAFFRFFGHSLMQNLSIMHPDSLLQENCFTALWHNLLPLKNADIRAENILNFCTPYIKERNATAALLTSIDNPNVNPIKAVADFTQKTERTIQQQHKKQFGFTAKERMRYQRFLETIQYLQQNPDTVNWFDIVYKFGYYDQSQLIHDFKHFTNLTPRQYLGFQQQVCMGI